MPVRPSGADKQEKGKDEQSGSGSKGVAHQLLPEIDHFGFGTALGLNTCHANSPQVCFVSCKVGKTTLFGKGQVATSWI
jgi:hypothetical protein